MTDITQFVPITKVDPEKRMVYGIASTPDLDTQGDIVSLEAIKNALPEYMKYPTVREMHQPKAAGKTISTKVDEQGLYIGAKIIDRDAWEKVKEGVYGGFSIGGSIVHQEGNVIKEMDLVEISLVDSPANKSAKIELWKSNWDKSKTDFVVKYILKFGEEVKLRMAKEEIKKDDEVEVATETTEPETPEVSEETATEGGVAETAENAGEAGETDGEGKEETVEASASVSSIVKAIQDGFASLKKVETVKVEKVEFAKASAVKALEDRLSKLESSPVISKVKSPVAVEKSFDGESVNPSSPRVTEINKRLAEISKVRETDLMKFQVERLGDEAFKLMAERDLLGSGN